MGQTIRLTPFSLVPAQNGWVLAFVGHRVSDLHIERGFLDVPVFQPSYLLLNGQKCSGGRVVREVDSRVPRPFPGSVFSAQSHASWRAFRPEIAEQFSNNVTIKSTTIDPFNVVVDAGKNIWALSSGSVRLVTTDRTIEVRLPGTIVGGARQVTQIASLGDGQYVFLRGAAGDTFYAKLAATGEPEFRVGPKIWDRGPEVCRDATGGLWLTIEDPGGHKVVDGRDTGITVRRVAVRGRAQDFPDVGLPVLVDDSGCVWLAPATANDGSTVTLWVPSGKTTTVTIPRRAAGSPLVAAGKGRVLAVTKDGLQELLADRTDQPENYALGKLYALDVPDGEDVRSLQYTSLGYLVGTSGNVDVGGVHTMLCLFNLDRASAGPEDARAAKTAESTTKSDAPASGDLRTWHDASGRHSLKATFVSAETGIVRLRKADGSTIDVPIDKLSDEDRKYIISTRAGTESKKGPTMKGLSIVAATMILALVIGCSQSGPTEDIAGSVPAKSTSAQPAVPQATAPRKPRSRRLAARPSAKPSFRRWAVICSEEARQAGLGDLMTAELSKINDLELVERDQLEAVTRELQLAAAMESQAAATRLKMGQLLKADALLFLSIAGNEKLRALKVVVSESLCGARLRIEYLPYGRSAPADLPRHCTDIVADVREHFAGGIRQIVGVSPLLSKNLVHDYDHLQIVYAKLLEAALTAAPNVAVIEIEEARAIGHELSLTGAALADRPTPLLVEGEYLVSARERGKPERPVRVHLPGGGRPAADSPPAVDAAFRLGTLHHQRFAAATLAPESRRAGRGCLDRGTSPVARRPRRGVLAGGGLGGRHGIAGSGRAAVARRSQSPLETAVRLQ